MQEKKQIIIISIVTLVVILGVVLIGINKNSSLDTSGKYDVFAKCVASKGLTMYGAVWCPHCQNEKSHFGSSFKYVPYVECPDNIKLCDEKGVVGFPTWIDSAGKKYEGEQGLAGIAKISGCELPQ